MDKKVEIFFGEKKYFVSKLTIEKLKKLNVEINDDYYEYLIQFKNPYWYEISDLEINVLLHRDFCNRILYDSQKGLGNILIYDNIGNIIGEYSSLFELLLKVNKPRLFYGFKNLHDKGIVPSISNMNFFGVNISFFDAHPYLLALKNLINDINAWRNGKKPQKIYNDKFYENLKKEYSLDEFILQKIRFCSFLLGELEMHLKKDLFHEKSMPGTEEEYKEQLTSLLEKYSIDNMCGFESVDDLNILDKYTGIYVLCFDLERKYYIGKTAKSFKERIIQHFTNPCSSFDDKHKPIDVSKIYVLHTTDEFIDLVEQDCIASIEKEFLLNSLAGGHSIDSIKSDNYDPNDYKLSSEFIKMVVEKIPSTKAMIEDEIAFENYFKQGNEAIKKLKTLKHEKITKELCDEAIVFDGNSLMYIPEKFKTPELCLKALYYGNDLENIFKCIPGEYLTEDYVIELIEINRRIIKYLPKELKSNKVIEAAGYKKAFDRKKI